jgi:hypothetical protein
MTSENSADAPLRLTVDAVYSVAGRGTAIVGQGVRWEPEPIGLLVTLAPSEVEASGKRPGALAAAKQPSDPPLSVVTVAKATRTKKRPGAGTNSRSG